MQPERQPAPGRRPGWATVFAAALLAAALLGACATPPADRAGEAAFSAWRAAHEPQLQALERRLADEQVAQVLPLPQLLRSASSWERCGAAPWALPPEAQWPSVVQVLKLLQALRDAGVVAAIQVHSGYRDEALNACAGGAARSAHRLAFAIDFTPLDGTDPTPGLCAFWRDQGPAWRMGLGRYPSGRIHIDTLGHRQWGGAAGGVCARP
jgi:hypothetical protein